MNKKIIKLGILSALFLPLISFAQQKNLEYIILLIVKYFNYAIYLTMALALVMFIWNIFKYFIKGGDDITARKEANLYVMWSIIGFFIMLSVWGLVNILTGSFKLDNNRPAGFFGNFTSSLNIFGNGQKANNNNNDNDKFLKDGIELPRAHGL